MWISGDNSTTLVDKWGITRNYAMSTVILRSGQFATYPLIHIAQPLLPIDFRGNIR